MQALGTFFSHPPAWAKVVVLDADGDHFSSGLDLSALGALDAVAGLHHSRTWHEAFDRIELGRSRSCPC